MQEDSILDSNANTEFTQNLYATQTPQERQASIIEMLSNTWRSTNEKSYETQTGNSGSLHYLWIRASKARVVGLYPGGLVYDTGIIHNPTHIKIHLNIAPHFIPEAIRELAKLQDDLHTNPDPQTGFQRESFVFKVALDDRVFEDDYRATEGKPPRIVIYPSTSGLFPDLGDRTKFDATYLERIVNKIAERLSTLGEWRDPTYRARYSEKLDSFSLPNESIEVVRGSTVEEGDKSKR